MHAENRVGIEGSSFGMLRPRLRLRIFRSASHDDIRLLAHRPVVREPSLWLLRWLPFVMNERGAALHSLYSSLRDEELTYAVKMCHERAVGTRWLLDIVRQFVRRCRLV